MVVSEYDVLDRLVCDFTHFFDHALGGYRCSSGVNNHATVISNDDASVRVTFGSVSIRIFRELFPANLLFFQVGLGSKFLFTHRYSFYG